ncbi:unnamed protein product [Phytomonas sp. EM1]|nr:unnamed protein product [Phytomonas sp. EM1]|eukprot:CCW61968.1 unnamed protein product [Phytomonas sp. isolate EM1]
MSSMGKSLRGQDNEHTASQSVSSKRRRIVGNYELGAILAIGNFDCYTQLCTYIPTGACYVARIYDKALLAETQWMWERVRESVHVQRTLPEHPNLIEMVECFETMTSLYIVMSMFSSTSVVKLFVSHLNPFTCNTSPLEDSRALIIEQKQTYNPETSVKQYSSTGGDGLLRRASKDFRVHDDNKVYNCYNDVGWDSGSNARNLFAPTLAPPQPTEAVPSSYGKEARRGILSRERDSPSGSEELRDRAARGRPSRSPSQSQAPQPQGSPCERRRTSLSPSSTTEAGLLPLPFGRSEPGREGVSGESQEGPVDVAFVRHVFLNVVHGVLHLHRHGVVHGGIAPDHVLYNADRGMVKISNMISCYRCRQGTKRTELRGTRHTVAPEVLKQEPYDPYLTDAWSLGVLLYFMLNGGHYPHDGANTLKHILYHRIRPMKPNIPASGADLVIHLLQPNPAERLTVEAILYHPFCYQGPSLDLSTTTGRVDDEDESLSRKDLCNDSFASPKILESSIHSFAGLLSGTARSQSATRIASSHQSSHRSLLQLRKRRMPSNSSLGGTGGGEGVGGSRNPAAVANRGQGLSSPSGPIALLPFHVASGSTLLYSSTKKANSLRLHLDARNEDEAAGIIQRAYRMYRQKRHFRWVTQTLLKKSSRRPSHYNISKSDGYGISSNRSLSFRSRQPKPWGTPKPSLSVQVHCPNENDLPVEVFPKDSAQVGCNPKDAMLPSDQENAVGYDTNNDVRNLASSQVACSLDTEEEEAAVRLAKSNFNATKAQESHQLSPLIPESKQPPAMSSQTFSFLYKTLGCRSPQIPLHHRSRLYNNIPPIPSAARPPSKGFRSNGGGFHLPYLNAQQPLRNTVSKPYANTNYEYKNGVFLPSKTM